jgi:E3 ubiquitin-protein ligase HERC3
VAHFPDLKFSAGGTKKLKATLIGTDLSAISNSFELDPLAGVAKKFEFFGFKAHIPKGEANTFSIRVVDHYDEVVPHYTGTIKVESDEAIPGLPLTLTLSAEDKGVKNDILTYTKEIIGTYILKGTDINKTDIQSHSDKIYVYKSQEFYLGAGHACILIDEKLKCWGFGNRGQIAQGSTENIGDLPEHVGSIPYADIGATPVAISLGNHHSCVLTDELKVKCFGNNSSGQAGVGTTNHVGDEPSEIGINMQFVQLDPDKKVLQIEAGCNQNCAILDDMSLKCWGENSYGVLGQGHTNSLGNSLDTLPRLIPKVDLGTNRHPIDISGGCSNFCALLDNNSVKCWGRSIQGRLGIEATGDRGDDPDEMGDFLPAVNIGSEFIPKQVIVNNGTGCALSTQGQVKCWGLNNVGQLGQGDNVNRGEAVGSMGNNLNSIPLGTGRKAIVIHSGTGASGSICALLDNNTGKCWG